MSDPNYLSEIEREDGTILTIKDAEARAAIDGMDPTLQQILQGVNDIKSSIGDVGEIIEEVLVGPPTLIEKTITENGTYAAEDDDADGYSSVTVDVANSYSQADNGKVVSNQELVAQTAYPTEITENDTYDTTNYNSITVNVSGGGSNVVARCTFNFSEIQFSLEDENRTIADNTFYEDSALISVTISNNATSIGQNAFSGCSVLETVTSETNSSLETIGDYAFNRCSSLTSITIPNSVTTIGDYAFSECEVLETVTFGANSSLETIGDYAFNYCSSLTSITIPDGVTTIGEYAFSSCVALTSITIPNSVTTIGGYAFSYCDALTSITIPNSVTTIGGYAFYVSSAIKTVTFEATTPPVLGGNLGLQTSCTIRVPQGTLSDYTSAAYYPDPSQYIYEEY